MNELDTKRILNAVYGKSETPDSIIGQLEESIHSFFMPKIELLYICLYQCAKISHPAPQTFYLMIGDCNMVIGFDSPLYEVIRYAYYGMGVRENGKQV